MGTRRDEATEAGIYSFEGSLDSDLNPSKGTPFDEAVHVNDKPDCTDLPSHDIKYALLVISRLAVRDTLLRGSPLIDTAGTAASITAMRLLTVLHILKKLHRVTAKLYDDPASNKPTGIGVGRGKFLTYMLFKNVDI